VGIPKIIHQTWKEKEVPPGLARYQASWKRLHPEWEYRLWTDADNDALVRDEFPELLPLYHSLPRAIHRADLARILFLARFGGLYVDLDIEALQPANVILGGPDCVVGSEPKLHAERLRGLEQVTCNAAMASIPGHPFWEKMLEEIAARAGSHRTDPVWMTGPLCLQATHEKHGERLGVAVWDPDVFFPLPDLDSTSLHLTDRERRYYQRMAGTGCYPSCSIGVHHWAHTWIPMHPLRRSLRRVAGTVEAARAVLRGKTTADEIARPERYGVVFPEQRFSPRRRDRETYEQLRDAGYETARHSSLAVGILIHDRIDLARIVRKRVENLVGLFGWARVHLIADDSTDGTESVALEWQAESPELVRAVRSVGGPEHGVARIAKLRNALLSAIEEDQPTELVAMLDGDLEGPISLDGVAHSIELMARDPSIGAVAAFGLNNWVGFDTTAPFLGYSYYDPYAFREREWERVESDAAIRWRLGRLRRGDPPVPVKSAFAGLAIYRAEGIRGLRYPVEGSDCEHVGFHRGLRGRGKSIFVNPSMLLLAGKQGHHQGRDEGGAER